MLRIVQSTSRARAKSYFSTADYYSEGQELVGQWRGKGAAMLGLRGEIRKDDWDRLCDNLCPDNGLLLTVRSRAERRVGWDFNFHVSKGVSLLYGLTRDERILAAFRESVNETMEEIECEAQARVRRRGADEDRTTGNLVWGEYVHCTGRPVDGVPDPLIHTHCFVFNATFDREERRWKAAQIGGIKRDAPYFEAVFHSKLARRMEELGLTTERTRTGWDLAGIEKTTLDKFSRRTAEIEKLATKLGITDPKKKAELGATTRSEKNNELSMIELEALWRERLTKPEAATLGALESRIGTEPIREDHTAASLAVQRAIEHVFERASVVPERVLLAHALKQGVGKVSRWMIEDAVAREQLVNAHRDGRKLVTTREVLEEERVMLAIAREGRGACRPIHVEPYAITRDWLNEQQRSAVRHVLISKDRIMLIRGAAGTGKTTMMQEAREAIETADLRVHAFAPSASASKVLRAEGFESADTVARLLADDKLQAEVASQVLWIDEAGLLGMRSMRQLFELARRVDARVVLSGDRWQHGPVERGGALRLLEEEAGLKPVEIREIQRQREQYKEAVKSLSEHRVEEGFKRLDKLGWIREVADEERNLAIASAYIDAVRKKKMALVISPTRAEGELITQEIRGRLRDTRLLGDEKRIFAQLVPVDLTLGQRRDHLSYQPGDVLLFHQNAKGHRKGERLAVTDDNELPLDQAERFTVYRPGQIELSPGDRIRITKNGISADRKQHRLNNGDLFTVKGFGQHGDIVLDNGWVVPASYGYLAYGFVVTSYASQGKTVDRVLIGQSSASFAASSAEQFYVSISRGREQATVFTDSKDDLLHAVSRGDERINATELVRGRSHHHSHVIRERMAEQQRQMPVPVAVQATGREAITYDR